MFRLLPLLGDVGLGILSVIFVSLWYEVHDLRAFLLLPFAFLPDLDAISEVLKKGKVAASKENPHDHRELLHKPIIWLTVLGALWWYTGFWGALAFVMVLVHFLHDSVLTGWGVPWLSPFSNVRIKFLVDEQNEVSLNPKDWVRAWNEDALHHAIVAYGYDDWIERFYLRPTVVSVAEYSTFALSIVVLCWFLSV